MGYFHFSRVPEAKWEIELLKMKAAGVSVIATYVIWIHHEEVEGTFDWSGDRDLRRFAQLCADTGCTCGFGSGHGRTAKYVTEASRTGS